MADEPLYCEICGIEWGQPGCPHGFDEQHGRQPPPAREERFCHFCGVIPEKGLECLHYDPPGRNKLGCNSVLKQESLDTAHLPLFRLELSHPNWPGVAFADVRGETQAHAMVDVLQSLRQSASPEDLAGLIIKPFAKPSAPSDVPDGGDVVEPNEQADEPDDDEKNDHHVDDGLDLLVHGDERVDEVEAHDNEDQKQPEDGHDDAPLSQVLRSEVTQCGDELVIAQVVRIPYAVKYLDLSLCIPHQRNPLGMCVFCNDQAE